MAKFGKFLLTTAAMVGTAATAYYIYKNVNTKNVEETPDEDYDDFTDLDEEEPVEETRYVPLTKERVNSMVEKVANTVENVAGKASDMAKNFVEKVSTTAEEVAEKVEETVEAAEEKVEEIVEAAEEKAEEVVEATEEKVEEVVETAEEKVEEVVEATEEKATDSFSSLPEQMAVEETVEEFFNDEDEN